MSDRDDALSFFSVEGEKLYPFELEKLQTAVRHELGQQCELVKLAEGGHHKVATLKYLKERTSLVVPSVHSWNSKAESEAGTEYMIIEKLPGVSAHDAWKVLDLDAKKRMTVDVAMALRELYSLRYSQAGSLYIDKDHSITVGPIISAPFYQTLDGEIRFPDISLPDLSRFRGPYSLTSQYLASSLHAEFFIVEQLHDSVLTEFEGSEEKLDTASRVMKKALDLVHVYPGDQPLKAGEGGELLWNPGDKGNLFSLLLDDFRLSNIMVEVPSGKVLGFIDFEATTTAPLWRCATVPSWLDTEEDTGEDGEAASLRQLFIDTISEGTQGQEWMQMYTHGKHFRTFASRLELGITFWGERDSEDWVDERLRYAKIHPGVGLRELTHQEDYEKRYKSTEEEWQHPVLSKTLTKVQPRWPDDHPVMAAPAA
ncbi:hypothetical protein FRC17_006031 [Serendipita sp. 399]|nr:hypothetical protein FRC17_006031 [Serendipita sp. 399]